MTIIGASYTLDASSIFKVVMVILGIAGRTEVSETARRIVAVNTLLTILHTALAKH